MENTTWTRKWVEKKDISTIQALQWKDVGEYLASLLDFPELDKLSKTSKQKFSMEKYLACINKLTNPISPIKPKQVTIDPKNIQLDMRYLNDIIGL